LAVQAEQKAGNGEFLIPQSWLLCPHVRQKDGCASVTDDAEELFLLQWVSG